MKTKTHTPKPNAAAKQKTEGALDDAPCSHSAILGRIAIMVSRYAPDGVCETEEIVRYLCRVGEAMPKVQRELERVRTDRLAQAGLGEDATAISHARHHLNCIANA